MLKAAGKHEDGRPLMILGLSNGNIERLTAGRPKAEALYLGLRAALTKES